MKVIFEAIQVLVVIVLDDLSNLDIGRRIRRFIASEKKQVTEFGMTGMMFVGWGFLWAAIIDLTGWSALLVTLVVFPFGSLLRYLAYRGVFRRVREKAQKPNNQG